MSTSSILKKITGKGSEHENRINVGYVAVAVVMLAVVFSVGYAAAFYSPAEARASRESAKLVTVESQPEVVREIVYTPTPTIIEVSYPVTVTRFMTYSVEVPVVSTVEVPVYYQVPVEVTRLVEVPAPTFTPTPVQAAGVVKVCVYLEHVKGVWIDGTGIAGNSCHEVYSTSPIQDVHIEVHR